MVPIRDYDRLSRSRVTLTLSTSLIDPQIFVVYVVSVVYLTNQILTA